MYSRRGWSWGTNGGTDAGTVAAKDPGAYTIDAISSTLGGGSTTLVNWLLLTSLLAVVMALHNMSSRYLMAIGREGVLPARLAHTHPVHQTPFIAAYTQVGLTQPWSRAPMSWPALTRT